MKKQPSNPVFSEKVVKALLMNCMVCGKPTEGFYGGHASESSVPQGTCSRECELVQAAKPKYDSYYSEENYLIRQSENEEH
jgi:hypothetical protein